MLAGRHRQGAQIFRYRIIGSIGSAPIDFIGVERSADLRLASHSRHTDVPVGINARYAGFFNGQRPSGVIRYGRIHHDLHIGAVFDQTVLHSAFRRFRQTADPGLNSRLIPARFRAGLGQQAFIPGEKPQDIVRQIIFRYRFRRKDDGMLLAADQIDFHLLPCGYFQFHCFSAQGVGAEYLNRPAENVQAVAARFILCYEAKVLLR